ncbi:MAG: serine/threonine-protein kinase [Rhizonema sp. NSF051]|nr:serine/threonine-protein kinase [Rhizonema sp. NSF051]
MSNFPDFSLAGYQVERLLGENRDGGRVTYLANNIMTQTPVVIKQFQFARSGATWSDYDAHHREIQVLRQLDHPSIPRYLDSFETPSGFCLVQEYIRANSLVETYNWTPKQIKQIAKAVLEVLVYLQSADPPVIHRDIKPDNILVNRQEKKVYLVDFGFARIGGGEVAVSSVVKGTLGFMPPEQMFNRQLTEASDLYSLGVTLVCLLTQTKSSEIGNLIDSAYRINVKQLIPSLNQKFVDWLQKMVAPELKNRFDNAAAALKALQPIDVVGNTPTPNKQVFSRKLSPVAMAVAIAALCLVAILGTTKIISIISHSGDHHRTEKHDKKKKHHHDRDDDEKKDQSDKGDDQDKDDDDD